MKTALFHGQLINFCDIFVFWIVVRSDRIPGPQGGKLILGHEHESVDYGYNLEYLNFCQPVGPRLGKLKKTLQTFCHAKITKTLRDTDLVKALCTEECVTWLLFAGECEKPSTMNWYLQGEHGLYREPIKSQAEAR